MCQPRVDRSVGSPSLEDSDIRIEKKWNWKEKRTGRTRLFYKVGFLIRFVRMAGFYKGVAQPKKKLIKGKIGSKDVK